MSDKIILEGISRCGRTTFANELKDKYEKITGEKYEIIRTDNSTNYDYIYFRDLLLNSKNLILDGFCYAQFVYSKKEERELTIADLILLEDIMLDKSKHTYTVYYVYTDTDNVFRNTQKDGKYSYYTPEYIHSLHAKYMTLFDTISTLDSSTLKYQLLKYDTTNKSYINNLPSLENFDFGNKLPYIVATEFDDVIAKNALPNINVAVPNFEIIEKLKNLKNDNVKLILWTRRTGVQLIEACGFCEKYGLYFDAINNNIEEVRIPLKGGSKKVWANEYWDSRSVKISF